jgi:broad specificity phosphatase PhoE
LPLPTARGRSRCATLTALTTGCREKEESVDQRCTALLASLHHHHQHHSIAIVAHCMVLRKLELLLLEGQFGAAVPMQVHYLGNAQTRSILISPAQLQRPP